MPVDGWLGRCYPLSSGQGSVCRRGRCCGAARTWRCRGDGGDPWPLWGSGSPTALLGGILRDRFWSGEQDTSLTVPGSVQELGPRLCRASPSRQDSLPGAGSPRRGAAQLCVRPAEAGAHAGFAPAGSYTWGNPPAENSAPQLATAQLFLVLSVLLRLHRRSPRARPVPTQTLLQPPVPQRVPAAAGTGTGHGGTWGSGSSCRGALQDPCQGAGRGSILPLQIN